jgi:subtilase family serine protease
MTDLRSLRRLTISAALLGGLTLAAPAAASASSSRPVCPGPAAHGAAKCFAHVVTDAHGNPLAHATTPSGYGPAQFHGAYNLPTSPPASAPAQTIAIVDAYDDPTAASDLARYNSTYGIPSLPTCASPTSPGACFAKVNQNGVMGSYPSANSGWALEIALDVETAHEICQTCKIVLVEASSASGSALDTAEATAAKLGATEISNSWGTGSEYSGEVSESNTYFNHPGVAVTVASGDSGYNAFGFPSASPDVIAVGGTTLKLTSGNGWLSESGWSGAGSGCSTLMPAPSWQASLGDWSLTGCGSNRGVADVAADADPNTGAAVYDSTRYQGYAGWFQVGGTSLASPLVAATYALAGNAAQYAYPAQFTYANAAQLHDVTSGPKTGNCSTIMCSPAASYDGPTGLGTPNGLGAF